MADLENSITISLSWEKLFIRSLKTILKQMRSERKKSEIILKRIMREAAR